MKLLSNVTQTINLFPPATAAIDTSFVHVLSKISETLAGVNETIKKLDDTLSLFEVSMKLCDNASRWNMLLIDTSVVAAKAITAEHYDILDKDRKARYRNADTNSKNGSHDDVLHGISKLAKGAEQFMGAISVLPEGLESIKKISGLIPDFAEGAQGLFTLFSAAGGGVSIPEGLAAGGSVMAGAAAVASAGAAFGPPGWLLGVLALAAGGVAMLQAKEANKELTNFKDISSDKMKSYYLENERQKDFEKMVGYQHVSNYKQLDRIEQELDSDYMVADRLRRVNRSLEQFHISFPDLEMKYGRRDLSGIYNYGQKGKVDRKLPIPWPQKKQKEEMSLTDKISEIRHGAVFESMGGKVDLVKMNKQIADARRKYKVEELGRANAPALKMKQNWRLPTENEWDAYVRNEIGLPQKAAATAKPARHRNLNSGPGRGRAAGLQQVIINLNRPMIENFIINTANIDEGLNDFKRKVEEVLIAILENAN